MSPDTISSLIPFISAAIASGLLVAEHYIPSHELARTTSYVIGSAGCLVPISLALMALDQLGTLTAETALMTIWITYIVGGLVVFGCYWRDGGVDRGLERKAEAAQRNIEAGLYD